MSTSTTRFPLATLATALLAITLVTSMAPVSPAALTSEAPSTEAAHLDWSPAPTPSGAPAEDVGGNERALVANTWDDETYRSTDGGQTWSPVDAHGIGTGEVVFDPSDDARGYIAGFGGIARTTDDGATWELVQETERSRVIDVHPDGTVAASIRADDTFDSQTFLVSDDGGDTWEDIGKPYEGSTALQGLAFGPTSEDIVVAGISDTWVSDDGGDTWTHEDQGARWLVSEPDGTLWRAGMGETIPSGDGTWEEHPERSTDGGQTWESVSFDHVPGVLATHPDGGLLTATNQGVHRTLDGGQTWTDMGADPISWVATGLFVDPSDPDAVFFTDEQIGINWVGPSEEGEGFAYEGRTQGLPPVEVWTMDVSPSGDVLLAGGPEGLYASDDASSWTHTSAGLGISSVVSAAATDGGERLYAGGSNGVMQPYVQVGSIGDSNWTMHILEQNDGTVVDIEVHPTDPDVAWAAVNVDLAPSKIYETRDGGESWVPVFEAGAGTPAAVSNVNFGLHDVTYDEQADRLVAGTGTGVFVQEAPGLWTPRLTSTNGAQAVAASGGTLLASGEVSTLWQAHTNATLFAPWADTGAPVEALELDDPGERAWAVADGNVHACTATGTAEGTCEASALPADAVSIAHAPTSGGLWAASIDEGLYRAATN